MPESAHETTEQEIREWCKFFQSQWTPQQEALRRTGLPADQIHVIRWTAPEAKFHGSTK